MGFLTINIYHKCLFLIIIGFVLLLTLFHGLSFLYFLKNPNDQSKQFMSKRYLTIIQWFSMISHDILIINVYKNVCSVYGNSVKLESFNIFQSHHAFLFAILLLLLTYINSYLGYKFTSTMFILFFYKWNYTYPVWHWYYLRYWEPILLCFFLCKI